jgi:hypothetical protein
VTTTYRDSQSTNVDITVVVADRDCVVGQGRGFVESAGLVIMSCGCGNNKKFLPLETPRSVSALPVWCSRSHATAAVCGVHDLHARFNASSRSICPVHVVFTRARARAHTHTHTHAHTHARARSHVQRANGQVKLTYSHYRCPISLSHARVHGSSTQHVSVTCATALHVAALTLVLTLQPHVARYTTMQASV